MQKYLRKITGMLRHYYLNINSAEHPWRMALPVAQAPKEITPLPYKQRGYYESRSLELKPVRIGQRKSRSLAIALQDVVLVRIDGRLGKLNVIPFLIIVLVDIEEGWCI
jgi:hypothetical protein